MSPLDQATIPGDIQDWPDSCYKKYERVHVLGKGSFGQVWMSRRKIPPTDEFDDEYVAIKAIQIKNEKSKIYAEREIRILQELRHPNVIRLIQDFPVFNDTRVVVMQLALGPNLHQLIVKRGALGLPLCRLVCRQLISAVGYIHGRAVIHRDVKPANCILALTNLSEPSAAVSNYDWQSDNAIWSNKDDGVKAVQSNKWKLMLVDFGFARALTKEEIDSQPKKMRNSIALESSAGSSNGTKTGDDSLKSSATSYKIRMINDVIPEDHTAVGDNDDASIEADIAALESMVAKAAEGIRKSSFEPTNSAEDAVMGATAVNGRKRLSNISMPLPEEVTSSTSSRRSSTARTNVRSMSALGTKAYAAPEIRKQLRNKTTSDFEKANAAMTECVADYGMIVDAYSVGWTLRVAMTGVPPNFTISEYMEERDNVVIGDDDDDDVPDSCCCFFQIEIPVVRIRDPAMLPPAAALLIQRMTEKKPEARMTVREAQLDPYIIRSKTDKDDQWVMPVGDYPSQHGDPVVPLKCAAELSQLTIEYHEH